MTSSNVCASLTKTGFEYMGGRSGSYGNANGPAGKVLKVSVCFDAGALQFISGLCNENELCFCFSGVLFYL